MSEGAVVALRGVGKTFRNGTLALDGLDLEVRRGEFLTVLGPSGCGKSSALRIIAGLSDPTTGIVEWTAGPTDPSRRIGFVFQEATLMPWATVADNVRLPFRLGGLRTEETDARVARVLEHVGLEGFGDVYPRELSGGMKMRVSIARAPVMEPDLLLMDEPFATLEEITRFRLDNDLLAVSHTLGQTVVFVLRIAGGLALIGAVVAEIAAGSAGAGSGLAYRIAESGYRLNTPRMFAALFLLSVTGIVIFYGLSLVTDRALRRWHESAVIEER